jgi:polar amino acid transport system ATP-binding protein
MPEPILRVTNLQKKFGDLHVLRGIDFAVAPGERVAIIGGSGSGKSTFLRCLNFMDVPTSGEVELDGKILGKSSRSAPHDRTYPESELCAVRERVGMVFQQFNLFPHMMVLENVMEGLITVKKLKKTVARDLATKELHKVGLADKLDAYPGRLSGGQQQRVAIARALAMEPKSCCLTSRRRRSTRSLSVKSCESFASLRMRDAPCCLSPTNLDLPITMRPR